MLNLKKQTYPSYKMLPKIVKNLKTKQWDFAKFNDSFYLRFLRGHFFTKVSLRFWNQYKIFDFFNSQYDLFQGKKLNFSEGPFSKFFDTRTKKDYATCLL